METLFIKYKIQFFCKCYYYTLLNNFFLNVHSLKSCVESEKKYLKILKLGRIVDKVKNKLVKLSLILSSYFVVGQIILTDSYLQEPTSFI